MLAFSHCRSLSIPDMLMMSHTGTVNFFVKQSNLSNFYQIFCFESNSQMIWNYLSSSRYWFPANIYLCKVNNKNTRKKCEICSKLTIKRPQRRQWRRSGVFIDNFEHISYFFQVLLLHCWPSTSKCWLSYYQWLCSPIVRNSEAYLEASPTSAMELFSEIRK